MAVDVGSGRIAVVDGSGQSGQGQGHIVPLKDIWRKSAGVV
jgi:hypothetical protein